MPLSWNEIKSRTITFVNEWKDETSEKAEDETFQNEFLNIFGISRRRVASFEKKVKHHRLDKAVDLSYRPHVFTNERNRIEFLFELYEGYTKPLIRNSKYFWFFDNFCD